MPKKFVLCALALVASASAFAADVTPKSAAPAPVTKAVSAPAAGPTEAQKEFLVKSKQARLSTREGRATAMLAANACEKAAKDVDATIVCLKKEDEAQRELVKAYQAQVAPLMAAAHGPTVPASAAKK
jgi:phosphate-selective porin